VLKELDCGDKPMLLVLNKVDLVPDPSFVQVLQRHHPQSVAVSASTGQGLEALAEAVIEALGSDFANAEVETSAGNGKVLSYLGAHAEIYRQEFHDNRIVVRCWLPKHLLHHIQGNDVNVRFLTEGNGRLRNEGP
jgi:GTP-binding protein HflX